MGLEPTYGGKGELVRGVTKQHLAIVGRQVVEVAVERQVEEVCQQDATVVVNNIPLNTLSTVLAIKRQAQCRCSLRVPIEKFAATLSTDLQQAKSTPASKLQSLF